MNTRGDCKQALVLPGTRSRRLGALLRGASEKLGEYEKCFGPVLHSCSNLDFQTLEPPGTSMVNTKVSFHCGCTRCLCLMSPTVRAFLTRSAGQHCHLVVTKGSAIQETCHAKMSKEIFITEKTYKRFFLKVFFNKNIVPTNHLHEES